MEVQLLCTFCKGSDIEKTLKTIITSYDIAFNSIYILENVDFDDTYCLTYNVNLHSDDVVMPESTINLHRKKSTNTLYTINALNLLLAELNNGQYGHKFKVPWEQYKNTILVTAYSKLKIIKTKLTKIVNVAELKNEY